MPSGDVVDDSTTSGESTSTGEMEAGDDKGEPSDTDM